MNSIHPYKFYDSATGLYFDSQNEDNQIDVIDVDGPIVEDSHKDHSFISLASTSLHVPIVNSNAQHLAQESSREPKNAFAVFVLCAFGQ